MTHDQLIDGISDAIANMEGFYLKDRPSMAQRNLNPGNIRQWANKGKPYPTFQGYVDFGAWALLGGLSRSEGLAEGWRVLKALVGQYAAGKYTEGKVPTLYEMFQKYAPSADANHPKGYAEFVAKKIGIPPDRPLNQIEPSTNA